MNQLIRCTTCDKIFMKTASDQWPEYDSVAVGSPGPYREIAKDDFQDFLKDHRNHPMENLQIIEDSFVSEKPYSEPTKTSYFKATNGKERFVIRKSRERIEEPLTYELIRGDYSLKLLRLEIQAEEIMKQLEREWKNPPLPRSKGEAFLNLCRRILKTVDIDHLERIPEDSSLPLETYYKMDEVSLAYLLRNCRNIFEGREYKEIEAFIHRHKEDGVLLLKATYGILIAESEKSKLEPLRVPHALNEKMMIEKK